MTDTAIVHLGYQVMTITFELAAPVLITALAVGFLVSLIQSATQIQEFTLSFVPKVIAIGVVLLVSGRWMMHSMETFTHELYAQIPSLDRLTRVNITLSETTLIALVLCMARVLAWTTLAPPFATSGIPRAIKPAIAFGLALAVTPIASAHVPAPDAASLAGALLENILIGGALGFGTRLLFSAVEAAGSLIDLFGGFSLAFALDPFSNNNNSVFGRFYALLTTTLLFASQAHLIIIAGFLRTFQTVPLSGHLDLARAGQQLVPGLSQLFLAALQIAGPLIVVLVVADVAMGLLNRIAPQLNVFSISFPLKILLTLGLVGLGFALLPRTIAHLADNAATFVANVTG